MGSYSSGCQIQSGWSCSGGSSNTSSACTSICAVGYYYNISGQDCQEICGDGKQFLLACDFGNVIDDDGCSHLCEVQPGWSCTGGSTTTPSVCTSVCSGDYYYNVSGNVCEETCGDGKLYVLECDDGNLVSNDGCSSICTLQSGFDCTQGTPTSPTYFHVACSAGFIWNTSLSVCSELCGDGFVYVLQCDDCNTISGDGCSSSCQTQSGFICLGGSSSSPSICRVTCSLGYAYQNLTSTSCDELCGDGILFTLPCDDGNLNDGDGCSSLCQIEPGYDFIGGNSTAASICSLIINPVAYNISLVFIEKQQQQNSVVFTFLMEPLIAELSTIDFTPLISCNISGVQIQAAYMGNGRLDVQLAYTTTIQNLTVGLTLDMASSGIAYYNNALPLVGSFLVLPSNNIPANYYSQQVYDSANTVQILATVVTFLALAGMLFSLISRKYIGVEMTGVVQISTLASVLIEYWSPAMVSLAKMRQINGYNVAFDKERVELLIGASKQLCGVEIGPNFVYSFNVSTVILLLPYISSLTFFLMSHLCKSHKDRMKKWAWDSLCAYGLTSASFCILQWTASLWAFVTLTKSIKMPVFAYNMADLAVSVWLLIPIVVLYLKYAEEFCQYRTSFTNSRLSQNHYCLILVGRFVLSTTLILGYNFKYVGFICCLIPIIMSIFVLLRKPYVDKLDNWRAVFNQITTLAILIILGCNAILDQSQPKEKVSQISPYAILALLLLCVVINLAYLLFKTITDFRSNGTQAAKWEDSSKMEKMDKMEKMEVDENILVKNELKKQALNMLKDSPRKGLLMDTDRHTQKSVFMPQEIRGRDETTAPDRPSQATKRQSIMEQLNDVLLRKTTNIMSQSNPIRKASLSPTKPTQSPERIFLAPKKRALPLPKSLAEYKRLFRAG